MAGMCCTRLKRHERGQDGPLHRRRWATWWRRRWRDSMTGGERNRRPGPGGSHAPGRCRRWRSTTRPCVTGRRPRASPIRWRTSCSSPGGWTSWAWATSRGGGPTRPARRTWPTFEKVRQARPQGAGVTEGRQPARSQVGQERVQGGEPCAEHQADVGDVILVVSGEGVIPRHVDRGVARRNASWSNAGPMASATVASMATTRARSMELSLRPPRAQQRSCRCPRSPPCARPAPRPSGSSRRRTRPARPSGWRRKRPFFCDDRQLLVLLRADESPAGPAGARAQVRNTLPSAIAVSPR